VPQAVLEDSKGKFVYVIEQTDIEGVFSAVRKTVATGELRNDGIEIADGLAEGDEVIISGASRVSVDMKVKRFAAQLPTE